MAITVSEKTFTSWVIRKNIPGKNRRWIYNPHLPFRTVLSNIIHLTYYHKYLRVYYLLLFRQFSFSFSVFKSCLFEILLVTLLFKYCQILQSLGCRSILHGLLQAAAVMACFGGCAFVGEYTWGTDDHIFFGNTVAVINERRVYWILPGTFPRFILRCSNNLKVKNNYLGCLSIPHIQTDQTTGLKNCLSSVWSKNHSILYWQEDTIFTNNTF